MTPFQHTHISIIVTRKHVLFNYGGISVLVGRSGAFPLSSAGRGVALGAPDSDAVGASCHAGIVGRPIPYGRVGAGDAGALGRPLLRLRRRALRDFSSCWSSASVCFSASLLFSIICACYLSVVRLAEEALRRGPLAASRVRYRPRSGSRAARHASQLPLSVGPQQRLVQRPLRLRHVPAARRRPRAPQQSRPGCLQGVRRQRRTVP
jgi:hypothetical protein